MPLGLYVSRCRGRLDRVVDPEEVAREAGGDAAVVRVVDDVFDPEVQERILADVREHALDAVVLAGNSPQHFVRSLSGRYLRRSIAEAGVSPNRVTSANLLEQVALSHAGDPDAFAKAVALVRAAVLEASASPPLTETSGPTERHVLVLGATTEGLVAAERLLELGFAVTIADRDAGSTRAAHANAMAATAAFVVNHPSASFLDSASVVDGEGWVGDFDVTLRAGGDDVRVHAGGILLAEPHRREWVDELRGHFKVDVDDEGCARAIDPSTHPAETVDPGIMVVPLRPSGAEVKDKVSAADSAAMALALRLSKPVTSHPRETSSVDESLCGGCASCVKTCAFGACRIGDDGLSHVDVRRCRSCGKCVVSCPAGARDIVTSPHGYLVSAIEMLASARVTKPKVLGFLCGGCGYPAADNASAAEAGGYPASFLPLRIPCGGRLDTMYVLEAFRAGFDAVAVFRCREGHCHNLIGNLDMDRRVNLLRVVLRSRGLDDSRLRIVDISPNEGAEFASAVNDLFSHLGSLAVTTGGAL